MQETSVLRWVSSSMGHSIPSQAAPHFSIDPSRICTPWRPHLRDSCLPYFWRRHRDELSYFPYKKISAANALFLKYEEKFSDVNQSNWIMKIFNFFEEKAWGNFFLFKNIHTRRWELESE